MKARPTFPLQALSFTAGALFVVGCGGGAFFAEAPGAEFEEEDPPPVTPVDSGPPPDAGPPPTVDAGNGCVTVTHTPTPAEDLAAFRVAGVEGFFSVVACRSCHVGSTRKAEGEGMGWGIPAQPADTSESEAEWFHSISTLLTLPRNSGKPIEETTLHRSFTDAGAPTHVDNPDAREAIIQWVEARQPSTETTCDGPGPGPGNDAGPGNGPDPGGDCVLPTKAESEARFILLDLGTIYDTCKTCHAGGGHSHAGTGDDWGTPEGAFNDNPSATAWHDAVWALTEPERHGVTVEESTLYHYVAGIPSGHFKYQQELDATVPWLDFVINGDESTGCP